MKRAKRYLSMLLINCAVALIPSFLLIALSGGRGVTAGRLWDTFRCSLVFANCIGWMAEIALPRVWHASCRLKNWARWIIALASMIAIALIGSLIACFILVQLGWIRPDEYWPAYLGSAQIAIFLTLLTGGTISMYETMRARLADTTLQLRTKELERERALKLATEAQLASLESRIHPHFLFNTLNSISSLIPEDPARAERLIGQMAALLRFSLDAHQAGLVPLASELKIVEDYLEIERARFGDRLRYRVDLAGELNGSRVPPLAVQTLVENSVKYAIAPSRAGGEISISAARENGLLRLNIQDPGPPFALDATPAGHGLDNLKGRLATLFGQQATITLERRGETNNLTLTVPQSNADPSISS
jgi:two-component system, LytTR family, sensor histidine kinase AlgZ